ncbi:cyd operon YbgE family protein [Litchfieldella rifensis]|uniref:Cyd operon YbgE family protein n=1 Tax=Litchfieldella rifensis TaxID=762643 RepID=A0ABV7LM99_9GAMM
MMRYEWIRRLPWAPLLSMVISATLALWLLWRPDLLSTLPLPLRLPLVVLGAWALGAGFMHGLGLQVRPGWPRRLLGEPTCWWLLGVFALIVLWRAF